jgi:hypothetical protein
VHCFWKSKQVNHTFVNPTNKYFIFQCFNCRHGVLELKTSESYWILHILASPGMNEGTKIWRQKQIFLSTWGIKKIPDAANFSTKLHAHRGYFNFFQFTHPIDRGIWKAIILCFMLSDIQQRTSSMFHFEEGAKKFTKWFFIIYFFISFIIANKYLKICCIIYWLVTHTNTQTVVLFQYKLHTQGNIAQWNKLAQGGFCRYAEIKM